MNALTSLNVIRNFVDNVGVARKSRVLWWYNEREQALRIKLEWVTGVPALFRSCYSLAPTPAPAPAPAPAPTPVLPGVEA